MISENDAMGMHPDDRLAPMSMPMPTPGDRVHGGPDASGLARFDFSVNANACGPCPSVLAALREVAVDRYPDGTYHALRQQLAAFHGVDADRLLIAGSASEFIFRISHWVALNGGQRVLVPAMAYGDYAHAARINRLEVVTAAPEPVAALTVQPSACMASSASAASSTVPTAAPAAPDADLVWACDPASPTGAAGPPIALVQGDPGAWPVLVLDRAYDGLRLSGRSSWTAEARDSAWQLFTPNKALGLPGVRGAYVIAPPEQAGAVVTLNRMAPSWVLGAHGVAMLEGWADPAAQAWLLSSHSRLRDWKGRQLALFESLGFTCLSSDTSFFCAGLPSSLPPSVLPSLLARLRGHQVQLRDTASFGLPGHVRVSVLSPAAQQAFARAWSLSIDDFRSAR